MSYHWHLNEKDRPNYSCGLSTTTIEDSPYDAVYLSYGSHYKVKIQELCKSAIYKQNVLISLCLSDSLQCRRGYYWRYISDLEDIIMIISSSYVLLACINTNYKYGHSWVI